MKSTTLILTLAVALLLSVADNSTGSRATAPQKFTVMYGEVPVSLGSEAFQAPVDWAVMTR